MQILAAVFANPFCGGIVYARFPHQPRLKIPLWRPALRLSEGYRDDAWETVTVPHDWSVTMPFDRSCSSGTGYLPGGTAWYRKRFFLPEEARGKRVRIVLDGVYKNAKLWCNSYYLGCYPYGYSEIALDVSDFASFGETENVLCVRVEREDLADSRWFTGCGIYRKVSVEISEPVGFAHHGVFFFVASISFTMTSSTMSV